MLTVLQSSIFEGITGYPIAARISINGSLSKSVIVDFRELVATRPLAKAVPPGFVFMAVTTQDVCQSDGTNWMVMLEGCHNFKTLMRIRLKLRQKVLNILK